MYEWVRLLNHSNKEIIKNFLGQLIKTKRYHRTMQRRGWWLTRTAAGLAGLQALIDKMICFSSPEYNVYMLCKFLRSRLIMSSRQPWNLHQRYKFLRVKVSRDILKFWVSEMFFSGVFRRYFPLRTPCCFVRIHETGNNAVEMSQVFQNIAQFKCFTSN